MEKWGSYLTLTPYLACVQDCESSFTKEMIVFSIFFVTLGLPQHQNGMYGLHPQGAVLLRCSIVHYDWALGPLNAGAMQAQLPGCCSL